MENRVLKLREEMGKLNLDAVLIEEGKNKRYLSGFTGTAGSIRIMKLAILLLINLFLLF